MAEVLREASEEMVGLEAKLAGHYEIAEDLDECHTRFVTVLDKNRQFMLSKVDGWFAEMDTNNDGFLDKTEVKAKITESDSDVQEELTNEFFRKMDANGDSRISKEEMLNAFAELFVTAKAIVAKAHADEVARRAAN